MSDSKWGSWCTPCKSKAKVDVDQPRFAWWTARFAELKSDDYAIRPRYGPEPCFQCGREMTSSYIYAPWVHDELKGEATATGGSVSELCSECWYADHSEPPERKVDKQTQCDRCNKELVVVYIDDLREFADDLDEDEEEELVEIGVDLRRHVCTQEYATKYIEVPPAWADDPGYWDDEILEQALGEGYGPDWEMDTETHSEEPAEIADVEVIG